MCTSVFNNGAKRASIGLGTQKKNRFSIVQIVQLCKSSRNRVMQRKSCDLFSCANMFIQSKVGAAAQKLCSVYLALKLEQGAGGTQFLPPFSQYLSSIKTPSQMSQTKYSITVSNLSNFPSLSYPHNNTSMWGEPCFSVSDAITSHILTPEIIALKILFSSQKKNTFLAKIFSTSNLIWLSDLPRALQACYISLKEVWYVNISWEHFAFDLGLCAKSSIEPRYRNCSYCALMPDIDKLLKIHNAKYQKNAKWNTQYFSHTYTILIL